MIRLNQEVIYFSTCTEYRKFEGKVKMVYLDRAVVEHKTNPKFTVVPTARLIPAHP